jgi:hypothetical protein
LTRNKSEAANLGPRTILARGGAGSEGGATGNYERERSPAE